MTKWLIAVGTSFSKLVLAWLTFTFETPAAHHWKSQSTWTSVHPRTKPTFVLPSVPTDNPSEYPESSFKNTNKRMSFFCLQSSNVSHHTWNTFQTWPELALPSLASSLLPPPSLCAIHSNSLALSDLPKNQAFSHPVALLTHYFLCQE